MKKKSKMQVVSDKFRIFATIIQYTEKQ